MIIRIYKRACDYLVTNLSIDRPDLMQLIKLKEEKSIFIAELDEDVACKVRDWAGMKLQKQGFDNEYILTEEGVYLEDIIDLLYK
jgi:hypothetical protein